MKNYTQTLNTWSSTSYYNENGKFHRLDGPAYESKMFEYKEWHLDGKRINVKSQEEFEKYLNLIIFE